MVANIWTSTQSFEILVTESLVFCDQSPDISIKLHAISIKLHAISFSILFTLFDKPDKCFLLHHWKGRWYWNWYSKFWKASGSRVISFCDWWKEEELVYFYQIKWQFLLLNLLILFEELFVHVLVSVYFEGAKPGPKHKENVHKQKTWTDDFLYLKAPYSWKADISLSKTSLLIDIWY